MSFLRHIMLAVLLMSGFSAQAHDGVHILDAYTRFLPGAKAGVAYFTIENHAAVDERLISVSTPIADRAELHTHSMSADGVMHMGPIEGGIVIPAESSHELNSGGDHVMIMLLKSVPKDGDIVTLTLTFEHAGSVTVDVPVDNKR